MRAWTHEVYAGKQSVGDVVLKDKRVFLRVDYNVPLDGERVADATKIERSIGTIQFLLNQGAAGITIATHLGRPVASADPEHAPDDGGVFPLLDVLNKALHARGIAVEFRYMPLAHQKARHPWTMMQNLRTLRVEKDGADPVSKELIDGFVRLNCDIEVNDAFGVMHREDYSVCGLPLEKVSGLLVDAEMQALSLLLGRTPLALATHSPQQAVSRRQLESFLAAAHTADSFKTRPERPIDLLVIGGCKLADKLQLVKNLLQISSNIFLGGLLGTPFHQAHPPAEVLEIAACAQREGAAVFLPADYITASLEVIAVPTVTSGALPDIRDIGPQTEALLQQVIRRSARIFWNGTLGMAEHPEFAHGTEAALQCLREKKQRSAPESSLRSGTASNGPLICAGGGDTAGYIHAHGYSDAFYYVFTGGGATLEALEGKVLPGVAALSDRL